MIQKLVAVTAMIVAAAQGCGEHAQSPTHAGDGITQFGDGTNKNYANKGSTGKLKFDTTYNAHKQNPQDVQNCEWSLYMMDSLGRTTFIKKGTYANAKIKVGAQVTRKVYLKSLDCGLWE
jgi:hypothetical protein